MSGQLMLIKAPRPFGTGKIVLSQIMLGHWITTSIKQNWVFYLTLVFFKKDIEPIFMWLHLVLIIDYIFSINNQINNK